MSRSFESFQQSRLLLVLVLGIFLVGALGALYRPYFDWDMMAYVGIVKEQSHATPDEVHAAAYGTVEEVVSEKKFEELKYTNERRKIAYEDPVSFVETLSYYRVRVGYWGLGYLLSKTGLNEVQAFLLISAFFYFATCVVVLMHLDHFIPDRPIAVVLATFVALYPPVLDVARVVVPDMMTIFGLVLGFSLLLRGFLVAGALALLASVFVRTDAGVLCVFLILPVLLVGAGPLARRILAAAILALAVPAVLWLNAAYDYPGWAKLFTTAWVQTLYYPVSAEGITVDPRDYLKALASGLAMLFQRYSIWLAGVLAVLIVFTAYRRGSFREPLLLWFGALIAYLPVRFMLAPLVIERYVTFYPILLLMVLVCLYWSAPVRQRAQPARARRPVAANVQQ